MIPQSYQETQERSNEPDKKMTHLFVVPRAKSAAVNKPLGSGKSLEEETRKSPEMPPPDSKGQEETCKISVPEGHAYYHPTNHEYETSSSSSSCEGIYVPMQDILRHIRNVHMRIRVDLINKDLDSKVPLVGIETNPGPIKEVTVERRRKRLRGKQKKKKTKVVEVVKYTNVPVQAKVQRQRPRRKQVRQQLVMRDSFLKQELAANPGNYGGGAGEVVARLDNFFDSQMVKKLKMSVASRDFLKMVFDPMHDVKLQPVGWPDKIANPSIVWRVPQVTTLSVPPLTNPNYPLNTVWDCHIILNPWLNSIFFEDFSRFNNFISAILSSTNQYNIGGLQAWATVSGTDFAYGGDPYTSLTGTIPTVGQITLGDPYTTGAGRLVALGVEVINTTNKLHVQGAVTLWKAPEPFAKPTSFELSYTTAEEAAVTTASGQQYRYPPQNQAQAFLYDGTRNWEAKDGAYMVATFLAMENPPIMVDYTQPWMSAANTPAEDQVNVAGTTSVNSGNMWFPALVNNGAIPPVYAVPATKLFPINQMGMQFTGLSYESTLEMKMTAFYEVFPSIVQAGLVTLARDNCPHDPAVLTLLAEVYSKMMIGVKSCENFDGEWWANVVEWLGKFAGFTASVFGLPEVGLAAGAFANAGAAALRR